MADVIIIRHQGESCAKLGTWIKAEGGDVFKEDDSLGWMEATIPIAKLHLLKQLPCVAYVREVFKYATIVVDPTQDAL